MSFIDCLNENTKKTLHDVTFHTVTASAFLPSPAPIPTGIVYSNSGTISNIANGSNNQILSIVAGSPVWVNEASIPQPEGLIYSNGSVESSITTGSNGQVLAVQAGVPTWVDETSIPQPEGLIYSNGSVESSITTGSNGQILGVVSNVPTWINNMGSSIYTNIGTFNVILNSPINSNSNPIFIMNDSIGGIVNTAVQTSPIPLLDLSQYNGQTLRLIATFINNMDSTISNLDTLNVGIGYASGVNFQSNSYQLSGNGTIAPYCQFFVPSSSTHGLYSASASIVNFTHVSGRFYYPMCLINFITSTSFSAGTYMNVSLTIQVLQ